MDWEKHPVSLHCTLKDILKEKDISALQLSKDIDHRRSTINDLINNKDIDVKRIPAQLIARLCAYLDVTPSDLFKVIHTK
ncbi:helix-turn-helix domain-containing protein [Paenibacillus solisilvae]|uniref:Helix-turn-helix domain-containing protein n=1 Tax=Paenibacillus solisilvae TaxID=2486751 RepID=A0ABW0W2I4_9BACL